MRVAEHTQAASPRSQPQSANVAPAVAEKAPPAAPAPPKTETAEPTETGQELTAPHVQREAAPEDMPPTEAILPAAEQEEQDEKEMAEPNVDELAQRVYSEIKRRLAIEWERKGR